VTTCGLPSMWVAVPRDPELQRFYRCKLVQKGLRKARVAVARKLGIRLWVMLRDEIDYHRILLILKLDKFSRTTVADHTAAMGGPP